MQFLISEFHHAEYNIQYNNTWLSQTQFSCQQKAVIHVIISIGNSELPDVQIICVREPENGWSCFFQMTVQVVAVGHADNCRRFAKKFNDKGLQHTDMSILGCFLLEKRLSTNQLLRWRLAARLEVSSNKTDHSTRLTGSRDMTRANKYLRYLPLAE